MASFECFQRVSSVVKYGGNLEGRLMSLSPGDLEALCLKSAVNIWAKVPERDRLATKKFNERFVEQKQHRIRVVDCVTNRL
jgi:hypothetical protein